MFRKLHSAQGRVTVTVDGIEVEAEDGEPVAALLLRLDGGMARTNPVSGKPRAPYCMMGVCFDCLVKVDGVASTQACLTPVRQGLTIERQRGVRDLTDAA